MTPIMPAAQQRPRGPTNALHKAAYDGSYARTVQLVTKNLFDVNQGNPEGRTPLMCASSGGHLRVVRFLVSKGANLAIPLISA